MTEIETPFGPAQVRVWDDGAAIFSPDDGALTVNRVRMRVRCVLGRSEAGWTVQHLTMHKIGDYDNTGSWNARTKVIETLTELLAEHLAQHPEVEREGRKRSALDAIENIDREIAQLRDKIADLSAERAELEHKVADIDQERTTP